MPAKVTAAMLTEDKFKIDVIKKEDITLVVLNGLIDEDSKFDTLTDLDGPICVNFVGVQSINSCGVRSWVNCLKSLADKVVMYEECTPMIVRQMNMVPSFIGHAQVRSAYVPYVCDKCETEKLVLVQGEVLNTKPIKIEEVIPCEACQQGEMELDGHPEQYFAFTK